GGRARRAREVWLAAFLASRRPLMFATLAILLAILPFAFLGPLASSFSRPLVFTFALAVISSVLVAFTLTPALAVLLLRGHPARRDGPFSGAVKGFFDHGLAAWIRRPRRARAAAGGPAGAGLAVGPPDGGRPLP